MRVFFNNDKKEFTIVTTHAEIIDWQDGKMEAWILNAADGLTPIGKKLSLSLESFEGEPILWPNFIQDIERWPELKKIELKLANYDGLQIQSYLDKTDIHRDIGGFKIHLNIIPDIIV